jgi:hypothetical protein
MLKILWNWSFYESSVEVISFLLPQNWLIMVKYSVWSNGVQFHKNDLPATRCYLLWSSSWDETLAPESSLPKPSYSALKVYDGDGGGMLHLQLPGFWNLIVIWCYEHNRTWGLSLFWNVVPHHWVLSILRCGGLNMSSLSHPVIWGHIPLIGEQLHYCKTCKLT